MIPARELGTVDPNQDTGRSRPRSPAPHARPGVPLLHALPETGLSPCRQPFVYVAGSLVAGILVERYTQPSGQTVGLLMSGGVLAAIYFVLRRRNWPATICLLAAAFTAGAALSLADRTSVTPDRLISLYRAGVIRAGDPVEISGVLASPPEPAPEAYYIDLDCESLIASGRLYFASGRARLLVHVDGEDAKSQFERLGLRYGSRIHTIVALEPWRSFSNPGSPDVNEAMRLQGLDLKGTIKSPQLLEWLGQARTGLMPGVLFSIRARAMAGIDRTFPPRVAGTLKAMLLNNRRFLDAETVRRLRDAGTFHVLAISGMHVGIISWALLALWVRRRSWSVLPSFLCLAGVWGYAGMVGMRPPVTRAALMISIALIGPLLFRRAVSANTVAMAAFLILATSPALIADPGFQLSFAAVGGIVGFAVPLTTRLRAIGEWRPSATTPHPPSCSASMRMLAELLYWNHRAFVGEMQRGPVRYKLKKSTAAILLNRLRIQWLLRGFSAVLIVSCSVQLFTLPLMAYYFNRVSPIGILLNVIAGVVTAVLMIGGFGAIVVGSMSGWCSAQLGWLVCGAHFLLVYSIDPFRSLPWATFRVPHYEGGMAVVYLVYFVPLASATLMLDWWRPVDRSTGLDRGREQPGLRAGSTAGPPASRALPAGADRNHRLDLSLRRFRIISSIALAASIVMVCRPFAPSADGLLTIHFLDVGQGDSALVVFPNGKTLLVDGGGEARFAGRTDTSSGMSLEPGASRAKPSEMSYGASFSIGEDVVSRALWAFGLTRVDYVLATHADADHIEGLNDVLRNFQIGEALIGHVAPADGEFDRFALAVASRGVPFATLASGDDFEIGGAFVHVLWPPAASGSRETSENNDSVVLRLVYGSVSVLLTGDIERAAEEALVTSGSNLRADVLKVPHHGSKSSSGEAFIDAVAPRLAVISVGERSRFGHPHQVVVDRYEAREIRLLRTGHDGMVTVSTDGSGMEVTTFRH
jgi:competence protein ComEC